TAETQVDVNSTCIQLVEATEGTIRDEENPLPQNLLSRNTAEIQVEAIAEVQVDEDNPQPQNLLIRSRVDECLKVFSSTTLKGIINPYLTLILPYLTR
ncbi:hypothetical protein MKW94_001484, partial [Papaver nudicaule]|nr:hypothetical protein [Papaver nudicaule]